MHAPTRILAEFMQSVTNCLPLPTHAPSMLLRYPVPFFHALLAQAPTFFDFFPMAYRTRHSPRDWVVLGCLIRCPFHIILILVHF